MDTRKSRPALLPLILGDFDNAERILVLAFIGISLISVRYFYDLDRAPKHSLREDSSRGYCWSGKTLNDSSARYNTNTYLKTLGGDHSIPEWVYELCPSVYQHFLKFHYSGVFVEDWMGEHEGIPLFTTPTAAHAVCSLEVAKLLAASISTTLILHAGSHLGAILHGGPIPWDDDVDALIPFDKIDEFFRVCNSVGQIHPGVSVKCYKDSNSCLKLTLVTGENAQKTRRGWEWPFLDIFSYKIQDGYVAELAREGENPAKHKINLKFHTKEYFPLESYYFGGIYMLGPGWKIAQDRYDFCSCKAPKYLRRCIHRLEQFSGFNASGNLINLECFALAKYLPFRQGTLLSNGVNQTFLMDYSDASNSSFANSTWHTSQDVRNWFYESNPKYRDVMNSFLPKMNTVEVQNINDESRRLPRSKSKIKVVEWNIERGTRWLSSHYKIREIDPDILILNEVDIGMARTGQLHVARALAFMLEMNYAGFGIP